MYEPKKKNFNSLSDLRDHLTRDTNEKIVSFNGWKLVTETTMYLMLDGKLIIQKPIKEKKVEGKTVTRRPDGPAADQKRVGTHGRGDNAKPDRKKASKVRATKVPKKVSKPSKSPK